MREVRGMRDLYEMGFEFSFLSSFFG